ncbi:endolytic transglycosylase MltG [Alkalicoccobacillus porphyridii]|uniref:Endolytic transglycosylase MltG n=1 Tax=Alkalicoccobacillus porphyridii TaxID=2597270 RepID=A0A553ZZ49_9BACI|nr:endolytic transglycosylase MltG [Alkalicoccobacillus porphyridii]TSB46720.1 endolytic transglycosylase MltG [Alkalicoccobacillus porphyridii]
MANTLRSFSLGLMAATISCGTVYFLNSENNATEEVQAEVLLSSEEMIEQLEADGFLVRNTEEWETELNTVINATRQEVEAELEEEAEEETEQEEQEEAEEPEEDNNEEVFLLIIRNGMTSFDVADELIRGNIIDNKQAFVLAAEEQNLAGFLKPGAYEITSGMSTAQIFEVIT